MIVKLNPEKNFLTHQVNVYSSWKKENKKLHFHLSLCNAHKDLEKIQAVEKEIYSGQEKQNKTKHMQEQENEDESQLQI